jgi:hypothetical protein
MHTDLDFKLFEGLELCDFEEFYERANVLAKRIIDRQRRGLYRTMCRELNEVDSFAADSI